MTADTWKGTDSAEVGYPVRQRNCVLDVLPAAICATHNSAQWQAQTDHAKLFGRLTQAGGRMVRAASGKSNRI